MPKIFIPNTIEEILELLENSKSYYLMAGGTDLIPFFRDSQTEPESLVLLDKIHNLNKISIENKEIVIGATATFQDIQNDKLINKNLGLLVQAIEVLGSPQIRHMGTIGGNICTSSPAGDTLPPLYVLEAKVEIQAKSYSKILPISEFIIGPRQNILKNGEIVKSIRIPIPQEEYSSKYLKMGQRKSLAISIASLAANFIIDNNKRIKYIKLAWGSVGPNIMRFSEIEEKLIGIIPTPDKLKIISHEVASLVQPITDLRASADYRRMISANLLIKIFCEIY